VLSIVKYIFLDALREYIFLHKVGGNDEIVVLIWEGITLYASNKIIRLHKLKQLCTNAINVTMLESIIYSTASAVPYLRE
jgi:hypothetical protein